MILLFLLQEFRQLGYLRRPRRWW